MPTDSNVPILGRIAAAINPRKENYANGRDYYGSPVHTALGRALDDDSWPHIRREYLFDEKDELTAFPHDQGLDEDVKKRDFPATFFYEVIQFAKGVKIGDRNFSIECGKYYAIQNSGKLAEKGMRDHARRMFFNGYAFILGQEVKKNEITMNQLKSTFNDPSLNNSIGKNQHDFYIKKIYEIYCKKPRPFDAVVLRFHDYNRIEFNRTPILYGPIFMTKIFNLNFVSNNQGTYLNTDKDIDFSNLENGPTSNLNFKESGGKHAAAFFVFCAAAERALLQKECCSPLEKVEELIRNAQDVSDILSREAIMPNVQQLISEFVVTLIRAIDDARNRPMNRFEANSLFNDIQAFINDTNPNEPDSVHERGSLHIVIPNDSRSLPESVIELKFHFFDMNKKELHFHYIESYSCDDEFGKPSDGYYFVPGSDNALPESDYLSCKVEIGTVLDPGDEMTAHVVAVLYRR